MASRDKFIHLVSPTLTGDAQYKAFSDIEANALGVGTTVKFYPGTYEMGTLASVDGLNFEGVGAREQVVLANCNITALANTVTFRNLTLSGNSGDTASTSRALFLGAGSAGTLKLDRVTAVQADIGVDNQGLTAIVIDYSDLRAVDRAIRSNAVVSANVRFSFLNASANAYFTGANATLKAVQVIASQSGGSNTGNTLETVSALIS